MTVLVLRLAGPLQSWGAASRFVRRSTEPAPTKSGVLGLIAAAQGRRRTDPIEDLLKLKFGVRIDQPGTLVRDFQTAVPETGKPLPLSYRYYLGDAVFLALLEAETELLLGVDDALRHPVFPLYLGRRSCPPVGPVSMGLRDANLHTVLNAESWHASPWHRRRTKTAAVTLATLCDGDIEAEQGELDATGSGVLRETHRDVPRSFDPARREYQWRSVIRDQVTVSNIDYVAPHDDHDPMFPW